VTDDRQNRPPEAASAVDQLEGILRNSSVLIVTHAVSSLISMALFVLLPRFLGDAEFGRLYLALSLTMIFGVVVERGLTQAVARAVARRRALTRPYLRSAVTLTGILGAGAYLALLGTTRLLGSSERVFALVSILGVVMVADALGQVIGAVFQGHERVLVPALARMAGNLFTLTVGVSLLVHGHGAAAVAGTMVLAAALRVALNAAAVRHLEGFRLPAPVGMVGRPLLAVSLPFVVWQALAVVYFRMDVVMLGWLTNDATLGWYGAASRLFDALCFLPQMLMVATVPVAARLWAGAPVDFRATVGKTLQLLVVATTPVVVGLLVLAPEIVNFLFTLEAFGPSVPVLRIHSVTLAVMFVDIFLVGILMVVGRERTWIAVVAVGCVLSTILSLLLIPLTDFHYHNGGIGAALATLLTEIFIMASALRLFPAGTLGPDSWRVAAQAAGAGAVMAILIVLGRAVNIPWMLTAGAGGLVYLAIVLRLGILPSDASRWILVAIVRRAPIQQGT
jgi:O-antigen/teichoic acid export membrane protein